MIVKRRINNSIMEMEIDDNRIYYKIEEINKLNTDNLYVQFFKNIYDISKRLITDFNITSIIIEENKQKNDYITFSILFENNKIINIYLTYNDLINKNNAICDIICVKVKDKILSSFVKGGFVNYE